MASHVCVVSGKKCWQDATGAWMSSGGFPLQMGAVATLFDRMTLLVTRLDRPGEGGMPLPAGAEVVALRTPEGQGSSRKVFVLTHVVEYLRVIARHVKEADAVHVPPPGDIPFLGMIVALALRRRLLVRYCGSWFSTRQTTVMNRITRGVMRVFAGGRNVMFATGAGTSPPGPRMSWVFATAVAEKEVKSVQPDLDRPARRPLRLVYAGRLSPEKGVHVLVEALHRLGEENAAALSRIRLDIMGDGFARAALEQSVRDQRLEDRVVFHGQVDRRRLIAALSEADVCVLPSLTESFCKARLDAMLCGAPVLTTDVGFGRELIGEDGERGWVVSAGDAEGLKGALASLLEDRHDWPRLRRRCRAFAEGKTLEAWVGQIGRVCADQWHIGFEHGKLQL